MHRLKTGALLRASVMLGALCGRMPDATETDALDAYAAAVGLAFQVVDDVLDATLRDVLTRTGRIDRCVSEFIRVTNTVLPERAFIRVVPELLNGGYTRAGVPVRAQLLGSDPTLLARFDGSSTFSDGDKNGVTSHLTAEQIDDLVAYLETL